MKLKAANDENTKSHRQSEARKRAVMSDEAFVSHAKIKKKNKKKQTSSRRAPGSLDRHNSSFHGPSQPPVTHSVEKSATSRHRVPPGGLTTQVPPVGLDEIPPKINQIKSRDSPTWQSSKFWRQTTRQRRLI